MTNAAQKTSTPPPAPQSAPPPPMTPYARLLDTRRRALLMELAEIEDQMIEAGTLKQRSVPPRMR